MATIPEPAVAGGTKVLNTEDGEVGWVMNGFTYDSQAGQWTEYEVETTYGVERWQREHFVLFSEIEEACKEDGNDQDD